MSYDFSKIGSKFFEELTQALSVRILGSGTMIYGSGPDGAREATFEGDTPFPSSTDRWNGYIVVQAKYREKNDSKVSDADWLIKQLKSELEKFEDKRKNLRTPDYYIISTNADLSAVATRPGRKAGSVVQGGISKVQAHLETWKNSVGLKEYYIWSPSQISAYLDNFQDIRERNAAWLATSDVLAEIMRNLAPSANFFETIQRAMASSLYANQYVRLRDAGHSTAEPIRVADVFVDLPLSTLDEPHYLLFDEETADEKQSRSASRVGRSRNKRPLVVATLIDKINQRFTAQLEAHSNLSEPRGPLGNRIVLKGGPGQGKSTVGQFLVQKIQSQILLSSGLSGLSQETKRLAQRILGHTTGALGAACRYPLMLSLPQFADRMPANREGRRYTILEELVRVISNDAAPSTVTVDDLRKWMRVYPWLVMMDGLDEVPPGEARSSLIREIKAFFSEVAQCSADIIVVVTTREQNYRDELEGDLWEHWNLAKLRPNEALAYADSLTKCLLPHRDERTRVLSVLAEAAGVEMTRRLMISPLQVTILVALVDLRGTLPGDRWQLFHRYFSVLRDREEQKGLWFSHILKSHRRVIEDIHFITGFILHTKGERSGGGSAYLRREDFKELVRLRLLAEDDDPASTFVADLTDDIDKIATERLVLLSSQVTDRVAFDVRSLQEYAAAAYLTAGSDRAVRQRLEAIAGSAHWTHVFQIASSRCFSETSMSHLREDITAICRELDDSSLDIRDRYCLSGSRLALILLEDGIAADAPNFRRRLFAHAIGLLRLGSTSLIPRLSTVVTSVVAQRCQEEIGVSIGAPSTEQAEAAWALLFNLSNREINWATDNIVRFFPRDPSEGLRILSELQNGFKSEDVCDLVNGCLIEAGEAASTATLRYSWSRSDLDPGDYNGFPKAYRLRFRYAADNKAVVRIRSNALGVSFRYLSVAANADELYGGIDLLQSKGWSVVNAGGHFLRSPSPERLAQSLRLLAMAGRLPDGYESWVPWPLAAVCYICHSRDDFLSMAERAEEGAYGDISSWQEAEARWSNDGVNLEDLRSWNSHLPFDKNIGAIGVPIFGNIFIERAGSSEVLETIVETTLQLRSELRAKIAGDLLKSIANRLNVVEDAARMKAMTSRILSYADGTIYSFQLANLASMYAADDEKDLDALQKAASRCILWPSNMSPAYSPIEDKDFTKLIRFLICYLCIFITWCLQINSQR